MTLIVCGVVALAMGSAFVVLADRLAEMSERMTSELGAPGAGRTGARPAGIGLIVVGVVLVLVGIMTLV